MTSKGARNGKSGAFLCGMIIEYFKKKVIYNAKIYYFMNLYKFFCKIVSPFIE